MLLSTVLVVAVVATITAVVVTQTAHSTLNEVAQTQTRAVEAATDSAFAALEGSLADNPTAYLETPVTGESTRKACSNPGTDWVYAVDGPTWCYAAGAPSGTAGDMLHLTPPSADSLNLTAVAVYEGPTRTATQTREYAPRTSGRYSIWSGSSLDLSAASNATFHAGGPETTSFSGALTSLGTLTLPSASDTGVVVDDAVLVTASTVVVDPSASSVTDTIAYTLAAAGATSAKPFDLVTNAVGSTVSFVAPHQSLDDIRGTALQASPIETGTSTCPDPATTADCYDVAFTQAATEVLVTPDDPLTTEVDETLYASPLVPDRYLVTIADTSYSVYARSSSMPLDSTDPDAVNAAFTAISDTYNAVLADENSTAEDITAATAAFLASQAALYASYPATLHIGTPPSAGSAVYGSGWYLIASDTVPQSGVIWFDRDVQIGYCGTSFYVTSAGCSTQNFTKYVTVGTGSDVNPRNVYVGSSITATTGNLTAVATGSVLFPWWAATPAGVHTVQADLFALAYDSASGAIRTVPTSLTPWPANPVDPYADQDLISQSLTFTGSMVGASVDMAFQTYEDFYVN